MEEEKAAAYYDELTRKGEGAARFKQGLGFSSSAANDDVPKPGSALASSSSFLSKFVKASSDSEKKAQLQSIHDKLNKKPSSDSRVSGRERDGGRTRRRSRSRERHRESRRRSRSRERHRYRDSDGDRGRRRSRSVSPRKQRRSEGDARHRTKVTETRKGKDAGIDYSNLIRGYDRMSSAERVKAKMKLQLSETAAQDSEKGTGWERFEFNKDAPLDDEEVEVAEDDASLVKHIGQSFRYSAVEARREEQIQAAHEEAMFGGGTALLPPICTDSEPEMENKEADKKELVTSLLSETVLAKQKGCWRDRVRQA